MKITSSILVTSISFLTVMGCSSGTSNNPAAKPAAGNVKDVALTLKGACTAQALPEIITADGKEFSLGQIPPGEYDYANGEIYVYAQGADTSKLEALVTDKADESGKLQAQIACTKVEAAAAATQPVTTDPTASPSPSPSPTVANNASADLSAFLKLVVNADGSVSTSGLRNVFASKDQSNSEFVIVQNIDAAASSNMTPNEVKGFAPSTQIETHYFVTDKGLTIISRQGAVLNGNSSYNFMKLVFTKAQAPTAPVAPETTSPAPVN